MCSLVRSMRHFTQSTPMSSFRNLHCSLFSLFFIHMRPCNSKAQIKKNVSFSSRALMSNAYSFSSLQDSWDGISSPVDWLKYVNRIHVLRFPPHRVVSSTCGTDDAVRSAYTLRNIRHHKSIYGDHKNLYETCTSSWENQTTKNWSPFRRKCRAKTV